MTTDYFNTLNQDIDVNTIYMIETKNQSESFEKELGNQLMELNGVKRNFLFFPTKNFADMISSISFIVVVLVISAACIAFVVLYNLK